VGRLDQHADQQLQLRVRRHLRPGGQPVGHDAGHGVQRDARTDGAHRQGHPGQRRPARRRPKDRRSQVHGARGHGQSGHHEADGRRFQLQGDGGRVQVQLVLRAGHRPRRRARTEGQGRRGLRGGELAREWDVDKMYNLFN